MQQTVRGYLSIATAATLWGLVGAIVVHLYRLGYDVLSIVTLRATISLICSLIPLISLWPKELPRRRDMGIMAIAGVCGLIGLPLFYFFAIQQVGVGLGALFFYTKPLFVVLFAAVLIGEAITLRKLIAVLIGFAGVALIVVNTGAVPGNGNLWLGVAAGLGAGVSGSIQAICHRYTAQRYPAAVVNTIMMAWAVLLLWMPEGPRLATGTVHYDPRGWVWLIVAGTVLGAIPSAFYIHGLRSVPAGEGNIVALMEPVTAVLVGILLLGEVLSLRQGAGIAMVLASAVLATWRYRQSAAAKTDATANLPPWPPAPGSAGGR